MHRSNGKSTYRLNFHDILATTRLDPTTNHLIENHDFQYRIATPVEREHCFLRYVQMLTQAKQPSGPEYKPMWDKGWRENLDLYKISRNLNDLLPKFVKVNEFIRFNGNYIIPRAPAFETNFVSVLRSHFVQKYFSGVDEIYEFGCGTGLNLVHVSSLLPGKKLWALDWSPSAIQIISELSSHLNIDLKGREFDMFEPDYGVTEAMRDKTVGVFTIGAMEQLGVNYKKFLNFMLDSNASIVVHLETTYEDYDPGSLFDFLPIKYIEKRNWLRGYFRDLRLLEDIGKLKIVECRKTFGSFFHDGYTVTAWRKL
jgi:hypothetical protein